jgi:hypothetical protein
MAIFAASSDTAGLYWSFALTSMRERLKTAVPAAKPAHDDHNVD